MQSTPAAPARHVLIVLVLLFLSSCMPVFAQSATGVPLTTVSLTANPPGRTGIGTPVRLTATPTGGSKVEYKFRVGYKTGNAWTWSDLRGYGTDPSCTWSPAIARQYTLTVWAREVGSTVAYQVYRNLGYLVTEPLTAVSLRTAPASSSPVWLPVVLTAVPAGGARVEFMFRAGRKTGGAWEWTVLRNYNASPTCTWTSHLAGQYTLVVYARELSGNVHMVFQTAPYTVTALPVQLAANPPSPQPINTPITLVATTANVAGLNYRFRVGYVSGGVWVWLNLTGFTTSATCIWTPTAPRSYVLVAQVQKYNSIIGSGSLSYIVPGGNPGSQVYAVHVAPQENGDVEYHAECTGHHFLSVIRTAAGAFVVRPHPGTDVNGWGTSWYAHPFLPGAALREAGVDEVTATNTGILVRAHGRVSRGATDSYGDWTLAMTFTYASTRTQILGTGNYSITLAGPLSAGIGDLNLYRLASSYLHDVPLLPPGPTIGDTGDMAWVEVWTDTKPPFRWSPPEQPSHFPEDFANTMKIDVIGAYNHVDTAVQGYDPITPAYKPTVGVTLASRSAGQHMIFGGFYDMANGNDKKFWLDNIGITPLIMQDTPQTAFDFRVDFESTALPGG